GRGAGHERRLARSGLLLGTGLGDLRPGSGRCQWLEAWHPYIADPPNGTFFKADTIAELARLVVGNRFQRMPLKYLEQTVARFNGFVAAGKDTDFEKPTMHRIDKAPFYAALIPFAVNDSIGGLKIDGHCQVIDIYGKP